MSTRLSWRSPVLDKDLTAPPGSPAKGDRYIVADSASGDWSSHDHEIAEWTGSDWLFTVPCECWWIDVKDEDQAYRFSGASWVVTGGGGGVVIDRLGWRAYPTAEPISYWLGWNIQTNTAESLTSAASVTAGEPGFHSHFVLDVSAASGMPFTIRVTGTSVDEASGVLTPSDTEDISVSANGYYQSAKSWIDAVAFSILEASKSCTIDVYRNTYWDRGNTDFTIKGCRLEFIPEGSQWSITLQIIHVHADGSLHYIDNVTFDKDDSPERADVDMPGKYKRTDYNHAIDGADSEGLIIQMGHESIVEFYLEVWHEG